MNGAQPPMPWLDATTLIPLFAGASVLLIVLLVAFVLLRHSPLDARIKAVAGPREARGPNARDQQRHEDAIAVMRRIVERLKLMQSRQADGVRRKLARSGYRSKDAVTVYMFSKLILPLAFAGGAAVLFYGLGVYQLQAMAKLLAVLVSALAGSYLPDLWLRNIADRRRDSIRKALPDALDLLVICTEAGLALDAAVGRVAREIGPTSAELADELGITVMELRFMPERRKALENLAQRIDLAAVQALVTTLVQTERFGTPIAQALRVLASELRTQRLLRAEEKAARLPATMTVPLIVFVLPALFVVLMGAAVLDIIDVMSAL